jgi:ribonuclease VapC
VLDRRRNPVLSGTLDAALASSRIELSPFTAAQARIARDAYQRFGRGSGHPARLNMGDCFSYALARDLGEPLLFKGRDFALTDIELVTEPDRRKRLSEAVAAYTASLPG